MTLLDTNVIVHYLKGVPEVVRRLESTSRKQLAISTITVYGLEYGALNQNLAPDEKESWKKAWSISSKSLSMDQPPSQQPRSV